MDRAESDRVTGLGEQEFGAAQQVDQLGSGEGVVRLPALGAELDQPAVAQARPFFTFTLTVTHAGVQFDAAAPDDARPLLDELFLGRSTEGCA